jgi:uncharacterized short protein YbdD (DUF466 family)
MKALRYRAFGFARSAWAWLRQVSGDAAYDNYLRSMNRTVKSEIASHSNSPARPAVARAPLSREDFYLDALRRRYSTISRCC